jgi:ubiquinone/menaquinone biosynthesis C-methylase UbiE
MQMNVEERFRALLKVPYPAEFIAQTIPLFATRTDEQRQTDKYDKDFEYVDRYTGLFAYANVLLGHGGGEGLYRTTSCALLSHLDRDAENTVLDIGCGVGRILYDCAELFPNSFFVGMDFAYNMCVRTKQIVISGEEVSLADSLAHSGFGPEDLVLQKAKTKKAKNLFIAQGSVMDLPFNDNSFNCVVNTYLIDRVEKPRAAIAEMIRVLRPGGLYVLTDPLNFEKSEPQKSLPTVRTLIDEITDCGVDVVESFDGLVYRQIKDTRGNYDDFMSFVCIGKKR